MVPVGGIAVRKVANAKPLPAADALPQREDIAQGAATGRAVPVGMEGLEPLLEAIRTGKYSPEEHLRRVMERQAELRARREEEKRVYDSIRTTPAEPWLGKDTPWKDVLWIRADTWEKYNLFPELPPLLHDSDTLTPEEWQKYTVRCPGTNFYYANKTLPLSYSLPNAMDRKRDGRAFFDGPVVCPVLFEQKGPEEDFRQEVWMGLTPMEMLTQKAGIDRARGRCVVGGLGLGWFLKEIAAKPEVTAIEVVDINPSLINWIRPRVEELYPEVARKVTGWIPADVYKYVVWDLQVKGHTEARWAKDDTCYLLDIWPSLGDADYDHTFVQLEQVLGSRLWGWGRGASYGGHAPAIDPAQPLPYERAYVRKSPCTGCPFSRTGKPWEDDKEGNTNPLRMLAQCFGPFLLPCHQEPRYEEEKQGEIYKKAQCAGAAIFRSNLGLAPLFERAKSFHLLPADTEKVFATPAEMLAHYNHISLDAAKKILDENPLSELLDRELNGNRVRVFGAKKRN